MFDAIYTFVTEMMDAAWFIELAILTASWVILCWKKNQPLRQLCQFLLLYVSMACANLACIGICYLGSWFHFCWVIALGGLAYGYVRLFSAWRTMTKNLMWISLYTISIAFIPIAGQLSLLVGGAISKGVAEGAARVVIYLFIPLVSAYLYRLRFDDYAAVPRSGLGMIAGGTVCILVLYAIECIIYPLDATISVVLLASYLSMLAMVLCAVRAMHTLCKEQTDVMDLQAENQRFLTEREMTRLTETKLEDLRCIRHDLKNQYAYMQILLLEKRYDELEKYFAKLAANLPEQLSMVDCGNRAISTVLNLEFSKLKADKITVDHQLVVPPVLPFPDEDMCAILTNLMDNAGDECRRMRENGRENVKLRLEIYPHQSYLYIKCMNPTDRVTLKRHRGGLHTTKGDERLHGYGTRIVAQIAEKYNGCADYSLSDGQFVAQVMLDMVMEEKEHEAENRVV